MKLQLNSNYLYNFNIILSLLLYKLYFYHLQFLKNNLKYYCNSNKMIIKNIYIFLYIFYSIFGYNFIYRYNTGKKLDICNFYFNSYAFIGKRLCMLSHINFLYTYYYLNNPSLERFFNLLFLQIIINSGYYILWNLSEISTFFAHIFWSVFIILHTFFSLKSKFLIHNIKFNIDNFIFITFLLFYSNIYKYIYTKRHIMYDNK